MSLLSSVSLLLARSVSLTCGGYHFTDYEYTFDTAWHRTPQPLATWFRAYAARRYGRATTTPHAAADAEAAWAILSVAVYQTQAGGLADDTGVEWVPTTQVKYRRTAVNHAKTLEAWALLVKVGQASATVIEALNVSNLTATLQFWAGFRHAGRSLARHPV